MPFDATKFKQQSAQAERGKLSALGDALRQVYGLFDSGSRFSFSTATPAAAGSTSADATALSSQVNFVTGADDAKGVALPAAASATAIYVMNTVMNRNLLVYPVDGGNDNINGGAEDAAFTLGPGKGAWFIATSATQWYVPQTAGPDRVNATAATLTVTHEAHGNKVVTLNRAGGIAVTLPVATGSGQRFTFVVGTTFTSAGTIKVPDASGVINGLAVQSQDAGNAVQAWEAAATDDTITLDGSTTGGLKGDRVELIDIASNTWQCTAVLAGTGSEATPFSATVS